MAFFPWQPWYETGMVVVDRHHKMLVKMLNELSDDLEKADVAAIASALKGLKSYTAMHFKYEEMLFDAHGYADAEEHKRYHAKLLAQVESYGQRYVDGDTGVGLDLLDLLKRWLTHHILVEDMAYVPQLSQHVRQRAPTP